MFSCKTVLSRSSFCWTLRKSGSILTLKKTMITAVVTNSSGRMVSARRRVGDEHQDAGCRPSSSGARVPIRKRDLDQALDRGGIAGEADHQRAGCWWSRLP